MSARFLVGDVFERMAELQDGSVDLVMTSPPFLALRSYLPADHPDKGKEIGSEATPAEFIDTLLALTAEWRRLLAPHGSICVELGDTYAGSGGAGGDYTDTGLRAGQEKFAGSAIQHRRTAVRNRECGRDGGAGWPLDKSLALIPGLYAACLAYGRNLLTGQESPAGMWRVRNLVAWVRPNPPVGALADKFRPATSYLTIATIARDRYFDLDAVRGEVRPENHRETTASNGRKALEADDRQAVRSTKRSAMSGAPPLDWWEIPPGGYSGSHYAVYPTELCEKPIEAMCPRRVCTVCGQPSRRIVAPFTLDSYRASTRQQTIKAVALADEHGLTDDHVAAIRAFGTSDAGKAPMLNNGAGKNSDEVKRLAAEAKAVLGGYFREFVQTTTAESVSSWSDCGHDSWRPGLVLDPFAGSGTTLVVAHGRGRDCIGIDIDERNADLARERLGMFLEVAAPTTEGVA